MNDYPLHRPMTIPQPPMPLHHSSQLPLTSGASSLPISTERHTSTGRLLPIDNKLSSQKKPRLAPNVSAGSNPKLTPDDSMYNGYLPSPTSAHTPNNYRQNGQTSHQLPYNYGAATSTPQQPFLPSSTFDFPSSSRGASISRTSGYNQRSSTAYHHHQESQLHGIYHQLMRHNLPPGQPPNGSNSRSQQSPDLLSTFLDNGDDHRPPPTQPSQFAPLDWPSHTSSQQPQAPPPPQQESGG
jgi:MADS-box transcription factor